jgi:hypothetical protein
MCGECVKRCGQAVARLRIPDCRKEACDDIELTPKVKSAQIRSMK